MVVRWWADSNICDDDDDFDADGDSSDEYKAGNNYLHYPVIMFVMRAVVVMLVVVMTMMVVRMVYSL